MPAREVIKDHTALATALATAIHTDRNSTPRGIGHRSDPTVRGLIDVTKARGITRRRIGLRQVVGHMVGECMPTIPRDVMNSRAIVRARTGRGTSDRAPDLVTVISRLTLAVVPARLEDTGLVRTVRKGLAEERHRVDQARVGLHCRSKVLMRARPWGCLSMRTTTERSARTRC